MKVLQRVGLWQNMPIKMYRSLYCVQLVEKRVFRSKTRRNWRYPRTELGKAAEHLGIEVYFLGYQDGELAQTKPEILLETITCWIDLVQPQVILTFGPDGVSGHPDHVTISHIVTQAYDQSYNKGLLLYIRPSEATALGCGVTYSNMDAGQPQVEIDISDYKLNKIRAIQSHASQDPDLPGRPEEEMEKIPCTELYTIAREAKTAENYPDWFEMVREEPMLCTL